MTERRRFVIAPAESGQVISLGAEESAHMTRVLRLRAGQHVEGVDGHGWIYELRLCGSRGRKAVLQVIGKRRAVCGRPLEVLVAVGLLKGRRMDWAVEKAAELGARALIPFVTDRAVASPSPEGMRMGRWRSIAVSALKQSLASHLMQVSRPRTFEYVLRLARVVPLALVADAEGGVLSLGDSKPERGTACLLVVGPEGGLSGTERSQLIGSGGRLFSLGANRLRSETAVTAALATLWQACA